MIAERLARIFEPGEDAGIALVEDSLGRADLEPRDDLVDKLPLAAWRKCRHDLLVIEDSRRDERLLASVRVGAQGVEVR